MKKIVFLAPLALLAMASCDDKQEMSPLNVNTPQISVVSTVAKSTRGYSVSTDFYETLIKDLHVNKAATQPRVMNLSSYLYPQEGEEGNYFVGNTFKIAEKGSSFWRNFVDGEASPVYWPVGGKLDFLAYSLTSDATKSVSVEWDKENAASKVVLTVPGENTQNDILYSSVAGSQQDKGSGVVQMTFKHAQAWLQFAVRGYANTYDKKDNFKPVENQIHLLKIELENIYNAGKLTIKNNGGDALASWDFCGLMKQNTPVDNNEDVKVLSDKVQYLDMLIPGQQKQDFVIYYTLGDDPTVLKYRFDMDEDSWLMGYKYVYNITMTTNEITVEPSVVEFVNVSASYDIY